MARRIFRHVLANQIQIITPASRKGFELTGDHGKNFEKLVRWFYSRIHDDFAPQGHMAGLVPKCERKAGRQAESFLLVTSATIEAQLKVRFQCTSSGNIGKIRRTFENAGRSFDFRNAPQLVIAKL